MRGSPLMGINELKTLVNKFDSNISYYKEPSNGYNENSTRIEYIDPLLEILGWDVANHQGLPPQYREVIEEAYSGRSDRPDYSLTLKGVTKLFVEAKKPSVEIERLPEPAIQTRKYGWNAGHRVAVLTNFEYLVIYDTTIMPNIRDRASVARYKIYHYTEYVDSFEEIYNMISRNAVYSGEFDNYFGDRFPDGNNTTQQIDNYFLSQINEWRLLLSNELYEKGGKYLSLEVLNDAVQNFINQIVFLRICEDRNLPLYHKLSDSLQEKNKLHSEIESLLRDADRRYNSGMFSGESIVFDLDSNVIVSIIESLYYPQSPFLFNIIEPNMLGKIYEIFLTEQLVLENNKIVLGKKRDCANRSVVTTPIEIVKYMVEKTMSLLCRDKTPSEIKRIKIADIACGSGIFLEEAFDYLQRRCISWYLDNDRSHLIDLGNGCYKLPLEEKKELLTSCIYGIDIDINAVEVAKFSLLIKLVEDETEPSVVGSVPILPNLTNNILYGNSLVSSEEIIGFNPNQEELIEINPFNWDENGFTDQFDAIIGNPPYVNTEGMHTLLPNIEFDIYKTKYESSYKQFDKYFVFIERAISKVKDLGYVCYIVPNKFFKVLSGEKLREILASNQLLVSIDDFGDAQLFDDRTIYSSIILLQKKRQETFTYSNVKSGSSLWGGEKAESIELNEAVLRKLPYKLPWRLTTDIQFMKMLKEIDDISVPITDYVDIYNGIQTSAERPNPVYWFSHDEVIKENKYDYLIEKNGKRYLIEKEILKPFFKPTKQSEKGLNSYSILGTDKKIIFPYDENGQLFSITTMETKFPGSFNYLKDNYYRLVPKSVSSEGKRDVPNATAETWYQYGRTQALTSFINNPKLIVGILSKEPMYALDNSDMLIASGGTAGYCAISKKPDSPYSLEYIQAWLSNPITEKILSIIGSDFEGGFISRGTYPLSTLPFVRIDFSSNNQKLLYEQVVKNTKEIYKLNRILVSNNRRAREIVMVRRKKELIREIEKLIAKVYKLEF